MPHLQEAATWKDKNCPAGICRRCYHKHVWPDCPSARKHGQTAAGEPLGLLFDEDLNPDGELRHPIPWITGCITPDSWDKADSCLVVADQLAVALLDPAHRRDGVSILGGEPFAQPGGLLPLVRALRGRTCAHLLCYSGYTYERLQRMATALPAIGSVLDEIDVLIDGPFVATLAAGAGPWTGSGNQRIIDLAAIRRTGAPAVIKAPREDCAV